MQMVGFFLIYLVGAVILYLLLRPVTRGAPYFTTKPGSVDAILRLAHAGPHNKVADLGSGDGRILIAFAERGVESHGFEINPLLVWLSRRRISRAGLAGKAFVHWESFWKADLSGFDIVVVYGITHIMKKLEEKLEKELKPGAESNFQHLPIPRVEVRCGRGKGVFISEIAGYHFYLQIHYNFTYEAPHFA